MLERGLCDESAVALTVPTEEADPEDDPERDGPLEELAEDDAVASATVALPRGLADGDPDTENIAVNEGAELGDASTEALAAGERVKSLENDDDVVTDTLPDAVIIDAVAVAVAHAEDIGVGVTLELSEGDAEGLFDERGVCEATIVGLGLALPAMLRETDGDELSVVCGEALFAAVLDTSTLLLIDEELVSDREPDGVAVTRIDADVDREKRVVPETTVVPEGEREMRDDRETDEDIVPDTLTSDVELIATLRVLNADSLPVADGESENAPVTETRGDAVRGLDVVATALVDGGADTLEATVKEDDGDATPVALETTETDEEGVGTGDEQLLALSVGVWDGTALVVSLTVKLSEEVAVTTEDVVADTVDSMDGVPLPVCVVDADTQTVPVGVAAVEADGASDKLLDGVDDGERVADTVELVDVETLTSLVVVTETLGDGRGEALKIADEVPTAVGDASGVLESKLDSVALVVAHALDDNEGSAEIEESGDIVAAAVKLEMALSDADTDALPDTVRVVKGVSVPFRLPELTADSDGSTEIEGEPLGDERPVKEPESDALAETEPETGAVPVAAIVAVSRGEGVPVTDNAADPVPDRVGIGLAEAQLLAEFEPLELFDADGVLLPRGVALREERNEKDAQLEGLAAVVRERTSEFVPKMVVVASGVALDDAQIVCETTDVGEFTELLEVEEVAVTDIVIGAVAVTVADVVSDPVTAHDALEDPIALELEVGQLD